MLKLNSIGTHQIPGRGKVFAVRNPHECMDFSHLINNIVEIDEKQYLIRGVEFAGAPPHAEGKPLGLLVRALGE